MAKNGIESSNATKIHYTPCFAHKEEKKTHLGGQGKISVERDQKDVGYNHEHEKSCN